MNQASESAKNLEPPSGAQYKTPIFPYTSPFPSRHAFYRHYFKKSTAANHKDWKWQLTQRITTLDRLKEFIHLSENEQKALTKNTCIIPFAITPYYMSLIDPNDEKQPLRKTVIPRIQEFTQNIHEAADPLGEESHSPVPGLIHRYPDRVLFLVTQYCSTFCRYCTRSRMVGEKAHAIINRKTWENAFEYIRKHHEVRDVLISGGDPLTLEDDTLEYLISRLRKNSHVEIIRIGTKIPAVLPQRITPKLCNMLKKYHPLFLSIHFTHPSELTEETKLACERLANVGIPLGSQTVLLRDVNDSIKTMRTLMQGLLKIRVKPYYIFQCDPILGSAHFRTSIEKGLEIIQGLQGHTSGYAVPHYVVDAPKGGGKIPLLPDYYQEQKRKITTLKNYEGKIYQYPYINEENTILEST